MENQELMNHPSSHEVKTSIHRMNARFTISKTALSLLAILVVASVHAAPTASREEMKQKQDWVEDNLLSKKTALPFSFIYDGKKSGDLLPSWKRTSNRRSLDANRTEHTITWKESASGLAVKCVVVDYREYPSVEWTVYFKNEGDRPTPILENIQGLDIPIAGAKGSTFVLNGNKGDFCTADSFEPFRIPLTPSSSTNFAPFSHSGRSSDGLWPYFNLETPGGGLILAIGWPGQWASSFKRDADGGLRILAGQQLTHLYLKPDEEIRTPLIVMQFWKGTDVDRSHNIWRRWYMAHVIPKVDGKPPTPITQIQVNCNDSNEVDKFITTVFKPDICWRDAGAGATTWYPSDNGTYKGGDSWLNTGTWEIDKRVYPHGFKPFSDFVHARDMKFLLWFEPERVGNTNTSWLAVNHPEWLLRAPIDTAGLIFNQGHPEALKWLTNQIFTLIKDNGIDWYREDMNGNGPLTAWRANDAPDRQGITENHYVKGHLAFWDGLIAMKPGLRIDACAAGGRRNDLETMRRAVPFLRSDFQFHGMPGVVEGNQAHTHALSHWLPYQGTGCYASDPYAFRSFYLPAFGMAGERTAANTDKWKQAYLECKEIAPMMLNGDFYPMTPYSLSNNVWMAWQFDRPETGEGCVQVFRRGNCEDSTKVFKLSGLNPSWNYTVTDIDTKAPVKVSGKELMQKGLTVEVNNKPGAVIFTYRRAK